MGVNRAKFVRWVDSGEGPIELVNEAKARTWSSGAEQALVELDTGEFVLIGGGPTGVDFIGIVAEDGMTLHFELDESLARVIRIEWHTHPRVTGPSDGDLEALAILGQHDSLISR